MTEGGKLDWHERIHCDPAILVGKPVVRGTRLSIEFILDLLAAGWSEAKILENYPRLSSDDLRAVFSYASDHLKEDTVHVMSPV
jgi:uncharacterized protein (DUF433 family)